MSRANKRWFHKRSIFQRKKKVSSLSIRGNMFSKKKRNWGGIVLACAVVLLMGVSVFYFWTEGKEVVATEPEIDKTNVDIQVQEENLTEKNEIGEWEGDKFKKIDGTYAAGEFIILNEDEYYFDQSGNKVTGEYEIDGRTYYFTEEGIFDIEKNKFHPEKTKIALTFDDGPGLYTEELLSILEENHARATFFVLGKQVKNFPEAVEKIQEIGCEIGNHTYSHVSLTELSKKDMQSQIKKTNKAIKALVGENAQLVRPPYGDVNSSVRKNVKYPLIMWSLDTEDWKLKDAEKIAEAVLSQVEEGDIVLLHDIHEFTFEAMKVVIPELIERGYQLVTVSELAEWNNVALEDGTKYFEF